MNMFQEVQEKRVKSANLVKRVCEEKISVPKAENPKKAANQRKSGIKCLKLHFAVFWISRIRNNIAYIVNSSN
jgi:hypothetical protein